MPKKSTTYPLLLVAALITAGVMGCLVDTWPDEIHTHGGKHAKEIQLIQDWNKHSLMAERFAEGFRVPVVARMYAYVGIAAYETATWRTPFAHTYNGMSSEWQKPALPDTVYLPAALNACYAMMMEQFFVNAPQIVQKDRLELKTKWLRHFENIDNPELINQSVKWGEEVAKVVFGWSATDSLGHMAQLHNYDRNYHIADAPGTWHPSDETPMPPLLPYWGDVRLFTSTVSEFPTIPAIPYSEEEGSAYYTQVYEIYALSSPLSYENKWIAEFWSDDHSGVTFSPAGRWISIAMQAIEQSKPSTATVLETYLKVGIALSDAAVVCWHGKYQYMTERPEVYIRKLIDTTWRPLHAAPPFPGYPSGHSAMGSAVAEVLTNIYGLSFKMSDRSHAGRKEFKGDPRTYASFYEMSRESAFSRLTLGVHLRADCEEGLRIGSLIGKKVADIPVSDPLAGG